MVLGEQTNQKKFDDIKSDFFREHKENVDSGKYHSLDLERLRENNDWIAAFYKYAEEKPEKTVSMLDEVLAWRNEFGTNNLLVSGKPPVPEELFKKGGMFMRNEDINCIPMLHFVVKTHKKDNFPQQQVFKFISYFLEKNYKFNLDDPIVLVFDMSDAGYSNLDMDMIKFVVTCLKTYYPGLIDYMIIYQMPFVFNAAWKIIKNWLPPNAVNLIKFCDKKSIKEYVQESQLFTHMGGTDPFKYAYDPKMFIIKENKPLEVVKSPVQNIQINNQSDLQPKLEPLKIETTNMQNSITQDKPIHTSESTPVIKTDSQTTPKLPASKSSAKLTNGIINKIYDASNSDEQSSANVLTTPLLTINPGDELVFNVTDSKQDITRFIKLTNTSDSYLAYKIKITSPDKFRVKPGTGIIPTSSNAQIMINFLKEYHNTVPNHRDKFLILWTTIDEKLNPSDLNEFWKQATAKKQNINEHKVKCQIKYPNETNNSPAQITMNDTHDQHSLPVSPSSASIKSAQFTTKQLTKQTSSSKSTKSRKSAMLTPVANEAPVKTKSKIEKLEIKDYVGTNDVNALNQTPKNVNEHNNVNTTVSEPNSKLNKLESNVNLVLQNQEKISAQYSQLIYLIFFLVILNVLQLVFQSNLFTRIIEPYIDSILFH